MKMTGWLTDTATVAMQTGANSYGDPAFAAQVAVKARVEPGNRVVVTASGDSVEATTHLVTETLLPVGTRVWLPGDNTANDAIAKRVLMSQGASTKGGGYTLYEAWL